MGAPGARIRRPESGKNKMRVTVSIAAPAAGGAGTVDAGARASAFTAGGESERAASGKRGKRVSPPAVLEETTEECGLGLRPQEGQRSRSLRLTPTPPREKNTRVSGTPVLAA